MGFRSLALTALAAAGWSASPVAAVPWDNLDYGVEGRLSAYTYSTGQYETVQSPAADTWLYDRKTSVGIRGETTDVYYYADLSTGSLGALSSSLSAFCPADECGVPTWSRYDARSSAFVRMKDTLTFTVPAGSYPDGVEVAIVGLVSGYLGSQGDTGAVATAHYYLHFRNLDGGGIDTISPLCYRVEAGAALSIFEPFMLDFTLIAAGTELTGPLTMDTLAEFALAWSCPVGTQGRSALEQGIGNAEMIPGVTIDEVVVSDDRVQWASASGVFLGHEPEDLDGDGVLDAADNCLASVNLDQHDTDEDGFGNACDADLNNDCIVNFQDLFAFKDVFFSNDADADFNGDGTVNFLDLSIMKTSFFGPPGPSGVPNICEGI